MFSCKLSFDFTFNALTRFYSFPTRFLLVSTRFYSFLLVALFTKRGNTFEFGVSVLRHAVIYETHPFFVIIVF